VRLGPAAFHDMNWWAAKTQLIILHNLQPTPESAFGSIDVSPPRDPDEKAALLQSAKQSILLQQSQQANPDSIITSVEVEQEELLRSHARCLQGIGTADINKYVQRFWEQPGVDSPWERYQMAPEENAIVSGCHSVLRWENGRGSLANSPQARVCGQPAWGQAGITIGVNNTLPRSIYRGNLFDCTAAVLVPVDPNRLRAIAAFVYSDQFYHEVRKVDEGLSVTESSFLKVPFDLIRWQSIADQMYRDGLPAPHTNDSTQWLFKGDIATSTDSLQVAVARMLGYCWPEQPKEADKIDALSDNDGIVCIPAVRGEKPAAERLLDVLRTAYGSEWSDAILHKLLTDAGCKPGTSLDEWL